MARNAVRFVRRGRVVERSLVAPTETLLDYLRIRERACGTKEGCAEGDCGACTVAVGRLDGDGRVTYQPVNSCILLLGMIDGAEIVTVEDLASSNGGLHPVQRAMVDLHASQCGFCTPGFVMSLFTLYHAGQLADRAVVNDWLAGNLCRCTGYRPIADAALACCTGEADDAFTKHANKTAGLLAGLCDDADLFAGNDDSILRRAGHRRTRSPRSACAIPMRPSSAARRTWASGSPSSSGNCRASCTPGASPLCTRCGRRSDHDRDRRRRHLLRGRRGARRGIDPDVGEMLRRLGSKQVRSHRHRRREHRQRLSDR